MSPFPSACRPATTWWRIVVAAVALLAAAAAGAASPPFAFRIHEIRDEQQGGLVVARLTVPVQWRVTSSVRWTYGDVSLPARLGARAESPDGSAWVEFFPAEIFFWLEPVRSTAPVGGRSLGMIHAPNIGPADALRQFVIAPYRGRMPGLQVEPPRPAPGMAAAFPVAAQVNGQGVGTRVHYERNGRPFDEDVYAVFGEHQRIPYTGPQGTWYEHHRPLVLVHALGAPRGQLDAMRPLLSYIATSVQPDPAWQAHYRNVMSQIGAQFNAMLARGYAQIQAAGALSRSISANNDAMLASMQSQRQAQARADASRRAASQAAGSGNGFSEYIRGVETMKDPYWGTSQQSSMNSHHWTDGQGNYRSSNDPSFNPNIGGGSGPTWQRMEPAR
jgi:hypothetical protein